jgi:hypothetical protein
MDLNIFMQLQENNEYLDHGGAVVHVLVREFADVFNERKELPLHLQYFHGITLEQGARPPNVKPFQYPPL